ncbi:hypothetical protein FHX74_002954 [Friedmanniella endophytica]|uniref:Uncharacterized protein n=1 Tax=Microlunatus kandeliicorticis TaxID=1759536 RepID=A0A7W3IU64_9ACTN|nr:hypothetical protein [Microlunatus kandeliicorticis]MBA8795326.1 hypothetical protein [Microlunatus kandeliicorticis]
MITASLTALAVRTGGFVLVPMHGIGNRRDLPLPFGFVVGGAAAALVVSFVVLFFAWRSPRYRPLLDPLARQVSDVLTAVVDARGFRIAVRVVVLLVYLWAGLALFAGQDLLTNPVFGFVFVWMWVGLVPLSLLLGPWLRVTNPLRTLHRGLCALARTDPDEGLATLPARLGCWPAAVGIFGFAWLELIQPDRTTLPVLRVWALAWLVLLVLGAVVFGRRWIAAADPFEVYASAVARLSPWRRVDGRVTLVNPLAGLTASTPPPGSAAVVAALLGSTAYDSFSNTTFWISTVQDSTLPPELWQTGGLLVMMLAVGLSFGLGTVLMAPFTAPRRRAVELPRLMAPTVVPIVVGYAIAHYATLLVVEGQRTAIHWSDPLGLGWNVFGSARMGVNASIYDHPTAVAVVQVVAIVGGHVLGIVAAHEKSLQLFAPAGADGRTAPGAEPGLRTVVLGQLPLLVVMVFYTCAGLLLLFSP